MHIDTNIAGWLNRIGIILNFLAGFMLAPELLGIDRLKRIERWIINEAKSVERMFTIYATRWGAAEAISVVAQIRSRKKSAPSPAEIAASDDKRIKGWARKVVASLRAIYGHVRFRAGMTIVRLYLALAHPLHSLIERLEGPGTFRGLLVGLGIFCFIFGNFIQLVATFS